MSDADYRHSENNFHRAGLARPGRSESAHTSRRERREKRENIAILACFRALAHLEKDDLAALVDAATPFGCPAGWPLASFAKELNACLFITGGAVAVGGDRNHPAARASVGEIVSSRSWP